MHTGSGDFSSSACSCGYPCLQKGFAFHLTEEIAKSPITIQLWSALHVYRRVSVADAKVRRLDGCPE